MHRFESNPKTTSEAKDQAEASEPKTGLEDIIDPSKLDPSKIIGMNDDLDRTLTMIDGLPAEKTRRER